MANSRKKCRQCKTFRPIEEMAIVKLGAFCIEGQCQAQYGIENMGKVIERAKLDLKKKAAGERKTQKAERKKKAESKRDDYKNSLKTREAAAYKYCHMYIRLRDKGKPCICCGKPWNPQFQAGHFMESGNYSFVRYHEDNIHGQHAQCNFHKGGDSGEYEYRLRNKIGNDRVDWIHAHKNQSVKRTPEDFLAIEIYYRNKIKKLKEAFHE